MIHLREYQTKCLDDIRKSFREGHRAPLLVAPTGAGKTIMFSAIAQSRALRGGRTMILAHRTELIDQIDVALRKFGIVPGIIAPDYAETPWAKVQVASVFAVVRRLERIPPPDFIIVDEAHHAINKTTWGKVLARWKDAYILGVTATPTRLSGEGLDDLFDDMIVGPSVQELIDIGALCKPVVYAPPGPDLSGVKVRMGDYVQSELSAAMSKSTVIGDAVSHYRKHAHQKPAIAFCVTREHAQQVAEKFRNGGYTSVCLDGTLDKHIRRAVVKDFAAGRINVLTNCGIVSEGFDVPNCEAGILLAPTQSLARYLQSCGRVLRPSDGKDRAIILDHAGNTSRFGLPTECREWDLRSAPLAVRGSSDGEGIASLRVCKQCFAANESGRSTCSECGADFPVQRKVREAEGELVEVTESRPRVKRAANPASTFDALVELGKVRGYKNPEKWAQHVWDAREVKKAERFRSMESG